MANKRKDSKNRVLNENESEIFRNGKSIGYIYRWRGKDKKRYQKFASTLEELRIKEREISINSYEGLKTISDKLTINDFFEKWKNFTTGNKANTFNNYVYMYKKYVESNFGRIRIKDVTNSDVKEFYEKLADEKHLSISTIDNVHTCLLLVFNQAVKDDAIRKNPASEALKGLKKRLNLEKRDAKARGIRSKNTALTREEQKLFVEYLENTPSQEKWKNIFIFMLETGLRVGEVTALQEEDIDYENNLVHIRKTLVYFDKFNEDHHCTYEIHSPKSTAGYRAVPLTNKAKEALKNEKELHKKLNISNVQEIDGFSNFIFLNRFGMVYNQGTLNKALRKIIKDCNAIQVTKFKGEGCTLLPQFSCHCTRHTFATRLHESNVKDNTIKTLLGHSDINTTLEIYATSQDDFNKEQIEAYEDFERNINNQKK